jgi:protein HIRA/HIR1
VGLDSKGVVWSAHTFEKLKTISSHQSHVKGLTFDPANKYFATASDDRTIKVYRFTSPGPNATAYDQMNNFVLEKTIAEPFIGSPLTTYFRRCSWSPDGNHIAAANAVNGPVSTVAIINRGNWDGDIHLVGHEGPVEVCAFSPRLFTKDPQTTTADGHNTQPNVTVIACAGQDKALSIWITSNPRPLVITQDLAIKAISDLSWSPDGTSLFVTSLDGTIIAGIFDEGELGHVVPLEENSKTIARFGGGRKGAGIVEGPNGYLLEEKSKEGEMQDVEGRMVALMGDAAPAAAVNGSTDNKDGGASTVAPNGAPNVAVQQNNLTDGQSISNEVAKDPHAAKLESLKQRVTITKEGKKRIAPLNVSNSAVGVSALPQAQLRAANSQGITSDAPQQILDLSKPVDGLPKGGLAALLLGNKRKLAITEGEEDGQNEKRVVAASRDGVVPIMQDTPEGLKLAKSSSNQAQVTVPEFIRPAVTNPSLSVSQVRLAVPKLRATISQHHGARSASQTSEIQDKNGPTDQNDLHGEFKFEAKNPTSSGSSGRYDDREPARLAVTKQGQPIWQDFLPRSVLLMTGGKDFWAVACEDASIHAWTPAGRRIMNALVLESQPVVFDALESWLLCITAIGMCYVWDIKTLSSPHPPVSLAPVLDIATSTLQSHTTKSPSVTGARVTSEGRIVVTLQNGDGYTYSPAMYTWQKLSEVWWAVGSQYWNTTDTSITNIYSKDGEKNPQIRVTGAGIIPYLERSTTNETLARGRAYPLQRLVKSLLPREGYESFEASVSMAHLENRLAAAMSLGTKQEFQMYLYMYAKRLGAEGLKVKVEELLRGLLGRIEDEDAEVDSAARVDTSDRHWGGPSETICGWPRHDLLKGVILILGKSLFAQFLLLLSVANHISR